MFGSLEVRLCFCIGLIEIQLNSYMHGDHITNLT
jgi:hypothetical protein